MPLIQREPGITDPYLVYDAPVDEKTMKVREMFKIDEKTGYPEQYNWRALARLGPVYQPADPYKKFDDYNPAESISTHVTAGLVGAVLAGCGQLYYNHRARRPWWAKSWMPILFIAAFVKTEMYLHQKTLERQSMRNAIAIDYVEKHPDRFPPIRRPKLREVLYGYYPVR